MLKHEAILIGLYAATVAIPVGLIIAAPVMGMSEPTNTIKAENYFEKREPRLIGFGCEPDGKTLLAVEEDEFPGKCWQIEPIDKACRVTTQDQGDVLLHPEACVHYWGDGWGKGPLVEKPPRI